MTRLPPGQPPQGPRGAIRLIIEGPFAALFWAKFASAMGVWMLALAGVVVVFQVTGSAAVVAVISFGQFAPQLILAPLAGKWADRYDMSRLIVWGQALCVLGAAGVAAAVSLPLPDPAVVLGIFLATAVGGIGLVVSGPAMQAIVPTLIRPGELSTATALSMFPNNVGRLAGPALAAYLVSAWHPAAAFIFVALLHLIATVVFLTSRFPAHTPRLEELSSSSVRAGLTYVANHRGLRRMLLAMLAIAVASEPAIALAPSLSTHLTGSDAAVGWLSSGFGAGALLGAVLAMAVPRSISVRRYSAIGLTTLAVGAGLTSVAITVTLAVACFALAGFGFALAMAGYTTLIQSHADPAYRGRVMALWLIAFVGARPLASLAVGTITDLWGVQIAFGVAGLVVLWAAWAARPNALGPRVSAV